MKIILTPVQGDVAAHVRYEGGVLACNGQAVALADVVTIEYGEEAGYTTVSDSRDVAFEVIQSTWIAPPVVADPPPAEGPGAAELEAWRLTAFADRWQVIVLLGEVRWAAVQDFRNSETTSWQTRMIIDNAIRIPRLSDTVEMLAWILQLDDTEVDTLFAQAELLRA